MELGLGKTGRANERRRFLLFPNVAERALKVLVDATVDRARRFTCRKNLISAVVSFRFPLALPGSLQHFTAFGLEIQELKSLARSLVSNRSVGSLSRLEGELSQSRVQALMTQETDHYYYYLLLLFISGSPNRPKSFYWVP